MEVGLSCYLHTCLIFQGSWEEQILILYFVLILVIVTVFLAKSPVIPLMKT